MEQAISKIKQAMLWLEEAVRLIEDGSLESLLKYYQIGYKGGDWHLQKFILKTNSDVERALANQLEKLISPIGFKLEDEIQTPNDFFLYYKETQIGFIDIYKKTIWINVNIPSKIEELSQLISNLNISKDNWSRLKKQEEGREIAEEREKKTFFGYKGKSSLENEKLETATTSLETIKKNLLENTNLLVDFRELETRIYDLIDLLIEYGFTLEFQQ